MNSYHILRENGIEMGPFSVTAIISLQANDFLRDNDLISNDRETWYPMTDVFKNEDGKKIFQWVNRESTDTGTEYFFNKKPDPNKED